MSTVALVLSVVELLTDVRLAVMIGEETLKAMMDELSKQNVKTDEFLKAMHDRSDRPYQDWSQEETKYNAPENSRWKEIYEDAGEVYNSKERMALYVPPWCTEPKTYAFR